MKQTPTGGTQPAKKRVSIGADSTEATGGDNLSAHPGDLAAWGKTIVSETRVSVETTVRSPRIEGLGGRAKEQRPPRDQRGCLYVSRVGGGLATSKGRNLHFAKSDPRMSGHHKVNDKLGTFRSKTLGSRPVKRQHGPEDTRGCFAKKGHWDLTGDHKKCKIKQKPNRNVGSIMSPSKIR